MNSPPQYIPLSAGQKNDSSNIRSAKESGVSGDGTSTVTLKKDFDSLGGFLQTIIGGDDSNTVTSNGTNNFGKQYFYNSGSKCSLENTENIEYCDPDAKKGDAVYEYIYVNTLSNGLMPGVIGGATNMLKLPGKVSEVMTTTSSASKCQCIPLKVTESDGTQRCAAAFINSSNLTDSDIVNNRCSDNILESIYNKTGYSSGASMSENSGGSLGSKIGLGIGNLGSGSSSDASSGASSVVSPGASSVTGITSFSPFKSGFTTMSVQKMYKNIDRIFLFAISILMIIVLYKFLNNVKYNKV